MSSAYFCSSIPVSAGARAAASSQSSCPSSQLQSANRLPNSRATIDQPLRTARGVVRGDEVGRVAPKVCVGKMGAPLNVAEEMPRTGAKPRMVRQLVQHHLYGERKRGKAFKPRLMP